jgi:hypothetical protein
VKTCLCFGPQGWRGVVSFPSAMREVGIVANVRMGVGGVIVWIKSL